MRQKNGLVGASLEGAVHRAQRGWRIYAEITAVRSVAKGYGAGFVRIGVKTLLMECDRPLENGYKERFTCKFRDELVKLVVFYTPK